MGDLVPEGCGGVEGQASLDGAIGRRCPTDFGECFDGLELRTGVNQPGRHQVEEHRIIISGVIKFQLLVGTADRVDEVAGFFAGDWDGIIVCTGARRHCDLIAHAQVKAELIAIDQSLCLCGQQGEFFLGVCGTDVIENRFPVGVLPDDLHGGSAGRGRYGPDLRWHGSQLTVTPTGTLLVRQTGPHVA